MPDTFVCAYLFGIVFGKYDIFASIRSLFSSYSSINRALIGLMLIVSAFYFQEKVFSNLSDMMLIITPVFMTGCILLLDLCKPLCKVMQFFGGLSTNMWLTHTSFCYYFYPFAIVIFWSRNPIVAYLTLLAITVFASVFLDKFYFSIEKLGVKLRKKIKGIKIDK